MTCYVPTISDDGICSLSWPIQNIPVSHEVHMRESRPTMVPIGTPSEQIPSIQDCGVCEKCIKFTNDRRFCGTDTIERKFVARDEPPKKEFRKYGVPAYARAQEARKVREAAIAAMKAGIRVNPEKLDKPGDSA
jgi:hypothetical protein